MVSDKPNGFWLFSDPIQEFAADLTLHEMERLTNFLNALTPDDLNELYENAGEFSLNQIKEFGFRLYESLEFMGEEKCKEAMRELFDKVRQKKFKDLIIQRFQESL